jgi:hypothetical protein
MRFLVGFVSVGAAMALIAASGLMNWVFMSSLGKSEFEQHILGAVSVAVSAFLALLPTLVLWAYREGRSVFILLGLPVFLAFGAFSLSSAVGFAAKNRGSISEDRALAATKLAGIRHEIEETETKLKTLGTSHPFPALQESLRGLEQDRRWQSSKSCTDATADASRSFCKGYVDLKAEAVRASERSSAVGRAHYRTQRRSPSSRRSGRRQGSRQSGGRACACPRLASHASRTRPHALPCGAGRDGRGARALFCHWPPHYWRPGLCTAGQGSDADRGPGVETSLRRQARTSPD